MSETTIPHVYEPAALNNARRLLLDREPDEACAAALVSIAETLHQLAEQAAAYHRYLRDC